MATKKSDKDTADTTTDAPEKEGGKTQEQRDNIADSYAPPAAPVNLADEEKAK